MRTALSNALNGLKMPETEARVLGELLFVGNPKATEAQESFLILSEDCFTKEESKYLFNLIKTRFDLDKNFDTYVIMDLIPKGDEWLSVYKYFTDITSEIKSAARLAHDCHNLNASKANRKAISCLFPMLTGLAHEQDPHKINESINLAVSSMRSEYENEHILPKTILEIADLHFQGFYSSSKKCPTGIETLDHPMRLNGGFNNGSLVTIAGQSGHGKTFFALYLALNIGLQNPDNQILFYNLEMTEEAIMRRYFSLKTGKLFDEMTTDEQMIAYLSPLHARISVFPPKAKNIKDIMTASRYQHSKSPVAAIVVDYIGLVDLSDSPEQHYLRHVLINSKLAELAIELNCVVIATTQVNRNASNRQDKRPLIFDSADSMGGQRSSSYWLGIYRPELDDPNSEMKGLFNVRCLKNREGLLFDVNFLWNNSCLKECLHQTGFYKENNAFENLYKNKGEKNASGI